MRVLTFVLLLLLSSSFRNTDEITWKDTQPLTWENFRGVPTSSSEIGAATHVNIRVTPKVIRGGRVGVRVKAVFSCDQSWARKKAVGNDYLLNHEQRHFDIAELYARKVRQALDGYRITTSNYHKIKEKVILPIFDEYLEYDEWYDQLTVHGLDKEQQQDWNERIDQQLGELEAFR